MKIRITFYVVAKAAIEWLFTTSPATTIAVLTIIGAHSNDATLLALLLIYAGIGFWGYISIAAIWKECITKHYTCHAKKVAKAVGRKLYRKVEDQGSAFLPHSLYLE